MSQKVRFFAIVVAVLGMGITMPQCPGQQAMQEQIDKLTTSNAALTKKMDAMDTQLKPVVEEMTQVKQLLGQMTNVIQAQKTAMEQMDITIKTLQTKAPAKAAKAKAAPTSYPVKKKK